MPFRQPEPGGSAFHLRAGSGFDSVPLSLAAEEVYPVIIIATAAGAHVIPDPDVPRPKAMPARIARINRVILHIAGAVQPLRPTFPEGKCGKLIGYNVLLPPVYTYSPQSPLSKKNNSSKIVAIRIGIPPPHIVGDVCHAVISVPLRGYPAPLIFIRAPMEQVSNPPSTMRLFVPYSFFSNNEYRITNPCSLISSPCSLFSALYSPISDILELN
jgi:hypothetical protein